MFKSIVVSSKPLKPACLVTGVFSDELGKSSSKRGSAGAHSNTQAPGFKAEVGETFVLSSGDILLGLGKCDDLKGGPETLRTVGARLIKRLDRMAVKQVNIALPLSNNSKGVDQEAAGRCIGEGIGLANWRFDQFPGTASNAKPAHPRLSLSSSDSAFRTGLSHGLALADSTNYARRIAAMPPNICNPPWVAKEAQRLAREVGLRCRVIDYAQAKRLGMGGIVNVGMGSAAKPCLVILEHKPARVAKSAKNKTVALVGKTVTFDTGGYSLKVNNGMKGMKYDKCGGCAVFGAMHAVATMKLPLHVVGMLTCAENMVSDDSYRPDDIIKMYNGVSVEVTNTDAEGRLVLGDALVYACKDIKATTIIDLATLTGGIVTALGHFCAGVFCNDDPLLARLNAAADNSGEKIWRMPLWKDHKEFMRAQHADILNSNPSRNAHPIQGAAFLAYFVDEKIPWAHLDIAGVANSEKDTDLFATGPTGYGVRLLTQLMQDYSA